LAFPHQGKKTEQWRTCDEENVCIGCRARVVAGSAAAQAMIDSLSNPSASKADVRQASGFMRSRLERDDFSSIRHPALSFCLSMIFSENRYPLFRIML
jgi:hypothetical protein